MDRAFKILSFNCEGVKRSKNFICGLLNTTDCNILCLQEIWTLDSTIDMLNTIHEDYNKYIGISDIDSTAEILHGRLKGGVAILFKKSLAKYVSYVKSGDRRICAIKLCMENNFSCLVTNVYLPCDNFSNTVVSDGFLDCINCIEGMLALANCDSYV